MANPEQFEVPDAEYEEFLQSIEDNQTTIDITVTYHGKEYHASEILSEALKPGTVAWAMEELVKDIERSMKADEA